MCLLDQRLRSLGFICVSGGVSQPQCFSFFPLCSVTLGISLMLWEVSVIKVCEMLWELPTERGVAAQKSMHSLAKFTVPMPSKTPFVLKLYRSHISANIFFTDTSFQLGEKNHTVKVLYLFYYAKPSRRGFESIYTAQKEGMGFLFSGWTLEVLSRSQKELVSIPGFPLASLALTHCVIWLN